MNNLDIFFLLATALFCGLIAWNLFFSHKIKYIFGGFVMCGVGVLNVLKFLDRDGGDLPNNIDVLQDGFYFFAFFVGYLYMMAVEKDA